MCRDDIDFSSHSVYSYEPSVDQVPSRPALQIFTLHILDLVELISQYPTDSP